MRDRIAHVLSQMESKSSWEASSIQVFSDTEPRELSLQFPVQGRSLIIGRIRFPLPGLVYASVLGSKSIILSL